MQITDLHLHIHSQLGLSDLICLIMLLVVCCLQQTGYLRPLRIPRSTYAVVIIVDLIRFILANPCFENINFRGSE